MQNEKSYDVVVVGAGLGGLAFTLALRERRLTVALVDGNVSLDERKLAWGYDLQPNGLLALSSLGLLDEVKALGALHRRWIAARLGGQLLSSWDYNELEHPHPYAVCVRPHLLLGCLRREANVAEHVDVMIPAQVTAIRSEPGCHRIVITTGEGERIIRAPLLVGADGPRSKVRQSAGISAELRRYQGGWVEIIAARSDHEIEDGHVFVGKGGVLGCRADPYAGACRLLSHYSR